MALSSRIVPSVCVGILGAAATVLGCSSNSYYPGVVNEAPACGSSDAGCAPGAAPAPGATGADATSDPNAVSGLVMKGPLSGADVRIYKLSGNGTRGTLLSSTTTRADGSFTLAGSGQRGFAIIVATGGTYVSEADGSTVRNRATFSAIVDLGRSGEHVGVVVSPISDLVAARARALALKGMTLELARGQALALVRGTYGLGSANLVTLRPSFDRASLGTAGFKLGLVLGSFDVCDARLPAPVRGSSFGAISQDLADGVLDGRFEGAPVSMGVGGFLSATAGTSDFISCVVWYAARGFAVRQARLTAGELQGEVSGIRGAVATSEATPKSTGLTAGSSGAISSLSFGGRQWLFIAARSRGLVTIDITDPDAVSPTTNVYSSLVASTFAGSPLGGVVPLLGADHPQVLVYAYGTKRVALVNAQTGDVESQIDLPLAASSPKTFSGGSAFIAGAIPDTGRDGAWLATTDGYLFFDRASLSVKKKFTISAPAELAENVGADVGRGFLFAANYAPGVQIVDLNSNDTSYYLDGAAFRAVFPDIDECDGGAVDSGYQVGIINDEYSGNMGLLDLQRVTRVNGARNTLTVQPGAAVPMNLGSSGKSFSGSAVDSDSHLVLFMAGFSRHIAVGAVQNPASVPVGSWKGLSDWRAARNLTGYTSSGDPHAVAVVRNLLKGRSYGYVLDGTNTKVLRVDMSAMLAADADPATRDVTTDPTTNGIVRTYAW